MHLSLAFLWVNPQGAQGGELYSFGNNFAGPRHLFESWSMVGPGPGLVEILLLFIYHQSRIYSKIKV